MSQHSLLDILHPLLGTFIEDPDLRDSLEETARIYYDNGSGVTVNLIPAVIVGLLLLLGALKLLGLPILASFGLDGLGGSGAGVSGDYGAPSGGYGAPAGQSQILANKKYSNPRHSFIDKIISFRRIRCSQLWL